MCSKLQKVPAHRRKIDHRALQYNITKSPWRQGLSHSTLFHRLHPHEISIKAHVHMGFPFIRSLLHCVPPEFWMYSRLVIFQSALGGEISEKNASWAPIGINPHVDRGFPFIPLLLHCIHPDFCMFSRPNIDQSALWNKTPQIHGTWEEIGIRPHVYKGFPLFCQFCTVYTPISAYLVGPSLLRRHWKCDPSETCILRDDLPFA